MFSCTALGELVPFKPGADFNIHARFTGLQFRKNLFLRFTKGILSISTSGVDSSYAHNIRYDPVTSELFKAFLISELFIAK
jgi:hypothetical protein